MKSYQFCAWMRLCSIVHPYIRLVSSISCCFAKQCSVLPTESILVEDSSVARTGGKITTSLTATSLSPALLTLALSDYLEEVLQLVWGDDSVSPGLLADFAGKCVGLTERIVDGVEKNEL